LFIGEYDRLADPTDAMDLIKVLNGSNQLWYRNNYTLGHMTFVWGLPQYE